MTIENTLRQLKDIIPIENFKAQPAVALDELLKLERDYKLNTSTFINDIKSTTTIPDEVREKWINTLDTFINFDGSMEDLNQY